MNHYPKLESALERAEASINRNQHRTFKFEMGTHMSGPAIDIYVDDDRGAHSIKGVFDAISENGYIVSNIKEFGKGHVGGEKTRIFLRDANEELDPEVEVNVMAESLFKTLLDFNGEKSHKFVMNREDAKVTLNFDGEIDFEDASIRRRLDQAGAFERPTAEGFLAGLLVGTTVAIEERMFGDLMEGL